MKNRLKNWKYAQVLIENTKSLIRKYFTKETDFNPISDEKLKFV